MEKYLDAPWIALPSLDHLGLAFGPSLVVPFIVAEFASRIKNYWQFDDLPEDQ